jgi:hypothetical protein
MSSYVSKTRFESQLPRKYCQMFSCGFNSGAREGRKTGVMFPGITSAFVVCHAARSMMSTAFAPGATWRLISSMWSCMASVSARGRASAAPTPRAGQMAPKR